LVNRRSTSPPQSPLGYTLWAGTVGFTSPLAERFAAAAATGCRQATLSPAGSAC
jgi:hypothetical protein